MQSFARVFHVETVSRSVERRGELQKLRNAVPKITQYKIQWGVRIFESWKKERRNDEAATKSNDFGLDVSVVELFSYR